MSFVPDERRVRLSDPRALRALAHPLRLALLDRLMSFGEQTAAQCATALESTTSNCSYHLRALERVGLVEPTRSTDGRERPWRATATGLEFGPPAAASSPASKSAARAVEDLMLAGDEELTRSARARHQQQPPEWQGAEGYTGYGMGSTPPGLPSPVAGMSRL